MKETNNSKLRLTRYHLFKDKIGEFDQKPFSLSDALDRNFDPKRFNGTWISGRKSIHFAVIK